MKPSSRISIVGARENNLKNVSIDIPKNKLIVCTGVSGSGKSSLVLDTLAKESRRQLLSTFSTFLRAKMEKISKPKFDSISGLQTTIIIDQKRIQGNVRSTVGTITDIYDFVRLLFARVGRPNIGDSSQFSFNNPTGMCPSCKGLGVEMTIEANDIIDFELSLDEGAILHPGLNVFFCNNFVDFKITNWYFQGIKKSKLFDMNKKLKHFSKKKLDQLLYSKPINLTKKKFVYEGKFEGVIRNLKRRYLGREQKDNKVRTERMKFFKNSTCEECKGERLCEQSRSVKYRGKSINDMSKMNFKNLLEFLKNCLMNQPHEMEKKIIPHVMKRLSTLVDLGIGYLSMNRATSTLSGGESQRIKISKQLSCDLVNMVYILDEPTIGLHPLQVHDMLEMLKKLRDKGNTVICIEHDMSVIIEADYIIEIGPKAGSNGGEIVFEGNLEEYKSANTLTSEFVNQYLDSVQMDESEDFVEEEDDDDDVEMENEEFFEVKNASVHNLKNVNCKIPVGCFTAITGLAGSGKSTLIMEVFAKTFENCVVVNQFKIGRSSRSNPATYTGCFDKIRQIFAKENSRKPGFFSFNSKGACEECKGAGILKIEMHFLEDAETPCTKCKGKRFKDEVLLCKYEGKNIHDVLQMTVDDALDFFKGHSAITKRVKLLQDVGLGYVTLGQSLSTLSGGETQRIKLATRLHKSGDIYILDEPSLGLSTYDIDKLLQVINTLKNAGNTVIVIEHNMDIVKESDWIIDLGPKGGDEGGKVLHCGKPSALVFNEMSHTAKYLRIALMALKRKRKQENEEEEEEEEDDGPNGRKPRKRRKYWRVDEDNDIEFD